MPTKVWYDYGKLLKKLRLSGKQQKIQIAIARQGFLVLFYKDKVFPHTFYFDWEKKYLWKKSERYKNSN